VTWFGAALPPVGPLKDLLALAGAIERLGYEWLWINDDRLQKDLFTVLAAVAMCTESIKLGPGVTNPYSRHPALIASAVATLDELSGRRAMLGLGAGGTNHHMLGIERHAPASALRGAVELIRGLLRGACVTVTGRVVRACDAELDFRPVRERIPIYIGARGPKILELAGELADGVIVGNVATVAGWAYALERVRTGAQRVGRDPRELEILAWLYTSIDDDPSAARNAVRPMVATTLVTSRPILDQLGLELPPHFSREMERGQWQLSRTVIEPASKLVPDELVDKLALAGTAAGCRDALAQLLTAIPEISGVVIVPFPTASTSCEQLVSRFMTEVAVTTSRQAHQSGARARTKSKGLVADARAR
jgi:5,10-methylenetetrahydromethanopterin reductase